MSNMSIGNIYRRGSIWHVRFWIVGRDGVRRRISISLKTESKTVAKKLAPNIYNDYLIALRSPEPAGLPQKSSPLEAIEKAYLEFGKGTKATRTQNINVLYRIVAPGADKKAAGKLSGDLITGDAITRFVCTALTGDKPRPAHSINSDIRHARAVFSKAARRDVYKVNKIALPITLDDFMVATGADDSRNQGGYIPIPRSSLADLDGALAKIKDTEPDLWIVVSLMRRCGMRNSEVLAARGEWIIDTEEGPAIAIIARPYFSPKNGRGGEILIDLELAAMLIQKPDDHLVAPGKLPTQRYNLIYREASAWVRQFIGKSRKKSLYELRKEAGSRVAAESGLFAAQALLRHKSQATTEKYYATSINRPRAIKIT